MKTGLTYISMLKLGPKNFLLRRAPQECFPRPPVALDGLAILCSIERVLINQVGLMKTSSNLVNVAYRDGERKNHTRHRKNNFVYIT